MYRLSGILLGVVSLALSCSVSANNSIETHSDSNQLVLNGELTQGSLVRAQLPVGSKVQLNGKTIQTNSQGKFVFGFDRSADLQHTVLLPALQQV